MQKHDRVVKQSSSSILQDFVLQEHNQGRFRHLNKYCFEALKRTVLRPIVGAKNALQETTEVGDVLRAHLYIFMMAVLGPVWRGWSFGQPVQMPARLYVHHIVTSPLHVNDKILG